MKFNACDRDGQNNKKNVLTLYLTKMYLKPRECSFGFVTF